MESEESLARLLKLAGERVNPRPEAAERARVRARQSWLRMLDARASERRTRWYRLGVAATAAVVAAIGIALLPGRDAFVRSPVNARVERIIGTAELQRPGGATMRLAAGQPLAQGTVVTGDKGRLAVRVAERLSLRLDQATHLDLDGGLRVTLRRGAVYVDSGSGAEPAVPLVIVTPAGEVRHLGTQYRVEVENGTTRIGVRDGRIRIDAASTEPLWVTDGEELQISVHGETVRRRTLAFGGDWEWAASVAPPFDIEDRSAADFLAWIAHEHGWSLRFDSKEVHATAAAAVLHGSIAGLSAEEALQRVTAITGLLFTLADGELTVRAAASDGVEDRR